MVHRRYLDKAWKTCTSHLWASTPLSRLKNHLTRMTGVHYTKMTEEIGEQVQIVGNDLFTNPTISILFFLRLDYGQPLILLGSLYLLTNPYVFRGLRRLSRRSHAMLFCLRCLLYPAFFCWICSVCSTHIWTVRYWVLTYSPFFQVNQIGSVTESIEAVKMSKHAGWGVMTSHRRYAYSWCVTVHVDLVWYLMLIFLFISGETEDTFIADLAVGLATVRLDFEYI